MLVIVGASGKLGFATLSALLDRQLIPPEDIVCTTSSQRGEAKLAGAQSKGVQVRKADWDDSVEHWTNTLDGCTSLFLISSARVQKDYGYEYPEAGREADHFKVLEAAVQAKVGHVYYTSLAFANPSLSRVMTAHERTERWLKESSLRWTVIREGLYNESWPLYLGYYDVANDDRREIVLAGDSQISWTSIPDLGLANAAVLAARSNVRAGETFYLSQKQTKSLVDVAAILSKYKDHEVRVKIVDRPSHERHYIEDRGMPDGGIWWWARTYDALAAKECKIQDDTLETILKSFGVTPKSMEASMKEMLS
jgi:uncharacterized protein YbjT (DUF2867 family)